jgi:hypothetical protein
MTQFHSSYDNTHPVSDSGANMNLLANTEVNWTVPGTNKQKYKATFRYPSDSSVWVGYNVTAAVPGAGTIVSAYKQEFKPDEWFVIGGDVLSFISTAVVQAGVSLLQIPN